MKVSSVSQMRQMDATAVDTYGIPEDILMENAGLATTTVLTRIMEVKDTSFLVVCGLGNNGGDGFVVARKLHSYGAHVTVCILGDPGKYKGAARLNLERITRLPISVGQAETVEEVIEDIQQHDVIVDGIFGTGLSREVTGLYAGVIDAINESDNPIISLDIPSGINGDNGKVMGTAIRANYTVTFGLPKIGNLLYPGFAHGGQLFVTFISFPPELYDSDDLTMEINLPEVPHPRNPAGHKGTFGKVLFIAGASSYIGAPGFAAMSFLKSGGGYARLAAPGSITPFIATMGSEIVMIPQKETPDGSISLVNMDQLLDVAQQSDMVVLGPGISVNPETQELVRKLCMAIPKPLLLDGDGLTAVAEYPECISQRKSETILTPHLGEMERISKLPMDRIRDNPMDALLQTCQKLKSIVILKGANSMIGYPNGRIKINLSGNSGMATAGSGDVLAGTIAAMYGLGQPIDEAAALGTFVHGVAGDLAAAHLGQDGITARDIMAHLPDAMNMIRDKKHIDWMRRYAGAEIV